MRFFAVSAPGLEATIASEVAALVGARELVTVDGGVEWTGELESLQAAHLWLRTATRVLVRVGEVKAKDFARLRRDVAALPWDRFVGRGAPVRVEVAATARKSRLYHTGAIAERVIAAVGERVPTTTDEAAPTLDLVVRGVDDLFTISVDASGELLHRRGYREETAKAPLRETLAAGLLALAGWDPTTPLLDPTCGSGTIVLEAALRALDHAPGLGRSFSFERWPNHDAARWDRARAEARARARTSLPAPLVGQDRDAGAVESSRRNAARGGLGPLLGESLRFELVEVSRAQVPPATRPGLILCNPPYGQRVGAGAERTAGALRHLYVDLGRLARRSPGWRLAVLTSSRELARAVGLPVEREHRLVNGGLPVTLSVFAPMP